MGEWKEIQLSDLVDIGSSKRIFYNEYVPNGIPFYRSKEVIEKHNGKEVSTELHILVEKFNEIKSRFGAPAEGDILLTSVGTLGIPYIVQKDEVFYFKDGNLTWFRNFNQFLLNKFLYYWIISPVGKNELDMVSIGSTQPALTIQGLKGITLKTPPLPEQKAIATVLLSLDDKIDLLHRQNKTLEAMAETLFRKWFVVEAQGHWVDQSLYDSIDLIGGGTPKTSIDEYWNGNIKWISAKDTTPNHQGIITKTEKTITESGLINSSSRILPKFSTIISARGTVGNYALVGEDMAFSQSNYGIKPKYEKCYFFNYLLIAHIVEELSSAAYGSVFDTITTKTFKEQMISFPPKSEVLAFEERIKPFFFKKMNNSTQINTLEKLRDNLLPKLMNGEVRVKYDAD